MTRRASRSTFTPRSARSGRHVVGATLLSLTAAACLGPRAASRLEMTLASPVVQVPMPLDGGVPMVEVRVAGEGPFWFKIDTGSGPCVFSERLVARARLPLWRVKGKLQGAEGSMRDVGRLADASSLTLGDSAKLGKVSAWVLPEADLDARGTVHAVDGILGFAALSDVVATLDYPRRRLILSREPLPEPDGKDVFVLTFDRGTPVVTADLGGTSFAWLVDTGNDQGPALAPEAAKALRFLAAPVSGPQLATVAGTIRADLARVDGVLALGAHEVPQPIVSLIPGARPMLGAEALRHFKVTFDARRKRVRFARDDDKPIVIPPRRTDGLGLRRAQKGWVVVDVVPGSPAAAAGIVAGEEVESITSMPEGAYRVAVGRFGIWRNIVLQTQVLVQ